MKSKSTAFINLLETCFTEYMPYAAGLSENTIRAYRHTFRLLLRYLSSEKNISLENITFNLLDYVIPLQAF